MKVLRVVAIRFVVVLALALALHALNAHRLAVDAFDRLDAAGIPVPTVVESLVKGA